MEGSLESLVLYPLTQLQSWTLPSEAIRIKQVTTGGIGYGVWVDVTLLRGDYYFVHHLVLLFCPNPLIRTNLHGSHMHYCPPLLRQSASSTLAVARDPFSMVKFLLKKTNSIPQHAY